MYFRQRKSIQSLFTAIVILLCLLPVSAEDQSKIAIGPGKVVSLSYTVSLADGKVVHSNVDGSQRQKALGIFRTMIRRRW